MEHIFPPKTIALVANTTVTISWSGPDIGARFNESVIKKAVSIRFSCSTTAANSVNCGVRYSTFTKDYLVAERRTLFFIPPNGTAEITPASKPALGLLNADIVSFFLDLTSPVTGNATVTLIVDDNPPPLSSEAGELIGLDAKFATDYISRTFVNTTTFNPGTSNTAFVYTIPAGKRAEIISVDIEIDPTPSFPGDVFIDFRINSVIIARWRSKTDQWVNGTIVNTGIVTDVAATVDVVVTNNWITAITPHVNVLVREIF